MKTLDSIPTNKIQRASKLVSTGFKIGGNYIRYYGDKIIKGEDDKNKLNKKLGRLTMKWIEKRYAPGGKGFQQALTSFQSLSAKTS